MPGPESWPVLVKPLRRPKRKVEDMGAIARDRALNRLPNNGLSLSDLLPAAPLALVPERKLQKMPMNERRRRVR